MTSRAARFTATGVAVACAVGLLVTPATADVKSDKAKVDREIAALREQLHDTSGDLSEAYLALRGTQARMPVVRRAYDAAQAVVLEADQYNDLMATRLQVAQANEARAVSELQDATAEADDAQRRVANFAAQMYQDQGMGQLAVALSATSPDEFATRIAMADTVMDVQRKAVGKLATIRAGAVAQKAHIAALGQDVAEAKAAAQAALDRAERARDTAAAAKQAIDDLARTQVAQAASVSTKLAAEKSRLATAQREQAKLQRTLVARARAAKAAAARAARLGRSTGTSVPSAGGFLSAPSDGWISSQFGMRYHPILHYWRLHAGRDYAANCNTPIRAAAPGAIISAGWGGGYGNRIMVDHGIVNGVSLVTTYNHMTRFARTGGHVSRGEVIGYVGTTGSSTGCHLHFETYDNGVPVDPRRWL